MKLILATVISFVAGAACAGELSTNGCRVAWTDTSLTIGNSRFTRRYVATADGLKTVSFKATGGGEFVREKAKGSAPLSVSCSVERPSPVSEECVNVRVVAGGVTNVLRDKFRRAFGASMQDWREQVRGGDMRGGDRPHLKG